MDFATFEQELLDRLLPPVEDYYNTLEGQSQGEGLVGLASGLVNRLNAAIARSRLRTELRRVFEMAYQVAGVKGNDGQPLDAVQHRDVLRRLAEAEGYLDGFIQDLPTMSRAQALARIQKYIPPILTTVSAVAASDLPELPYMPNDPRLDCVQSAGGLPVCRCRLDIQRIGPRDWDVYWLLDPAGKEHCDSCRTLAATWKPLRIRNGRIVTLRVA